MKTIAFIPARGGSKRLPGKNIMQLGNLPLIAYSILYAKYNNIDEIVVSTDNEEIAKIAEKYGAVILFRPAELATDTATTAIAAKHCANHYAQQSINFDAFITLQPTNPIRPKELYKIAIDTFQNKLPDCVFSVSENKKKLSKIINNKIEPFSYYFGQRTQDIEPLYYENGLIYISKFTNVLNGTLFGENIYPVITQGAEYNIDIDEAFDLEMASFFLEKKPNLLSYLNT